jgi:hypothetical protein
MIVGNLNLGCVFIGPDEADAVLIVDPDAVLPFPVAFQSFQTISWQGGQFFQRFCGVEHQQLAPSDSFYCFVLPREFVVEELFGLPVPKRTNHTFSVMR